MGSFPAVWNRPEVRWSCSYAMNCPFLGIRFDCRLVYSRTMVHLNFSFFDAIVYLFSVG